MSLEKAVEQEEVKEVEVRMKGIQKNSAFAIAHLFGDRKKAVSASNSTRSLLRTFTSSTSSTSSYSRTAYSRMILGLKSWIGTGTLSCGIMVAGVVPGWAATADDVVTVAIAAVPADELMAGNPARANAIAAVVDAPGLTPADRAQVRAALAEAWLDALDPTKAEAVITEILAQTRLDEAVRERVLLTWIAAWQVRAWAAPEAGVAHALSDPVAGVVALSPTHVPSARVRARALAARAQVSFSQAKTEAQVKTEAKAKTDAQGLADLDAALALLAAADVSERVPLYALRLTAMEGSGAAPEAVRVFLQQHRADPAATIAAEAALTALQKMSGQPAPALRLARRDGKPGELTLVDLQKAHPGKPVLINVFATWGKPCALTAPAVTAIAKRWQPKGVSVIGVSLDTKDTIAALPAWIATYAIDYPVVGDALGWDSEFAQAWHVDSIPRLILVDGQGIIVSADLGGATTDEVERSVDQAIQSLLNPIHVVIDDGTKKAPVEDVIP